MATRGAIATRDSAVRNRMRRVQARLTKRLGFAEPETVRYARDPNLRRVQELEGHVAFLEAVDAAIKDEGYSAAPGNEGKQDEPETNAAPPVSDQATPETVAPKPAKSAPRKKS